MPNIRTPLVAMLAPLFLAIATTSCREYDATLPNERAAAAPTAPQPATLAAVTVPGRTLAANCFQCHGTDGHASELGIAGESVSEIVSELNEMRTKHPGDNIMHVHALAYTPAEITLIATYFSKQ